MRLVTYILGVGVLVLAAVTLVRQQNPPAFERLSPPPGEESAPSLSELPRMWALPDFSLVERSGQPLTLSSLRGTVWVADFFYTSCPGPCLMLTTRFSALQKELAGAANVRFVSISTDPETDTPEILRKYAERFEATDRWSFLTGDKQAIYRLANQGFKLSLVEDAQNPAAPIDHSTKLALVDGTGTVRGVYDGLGEEGKGKLLRDIRRLLAEKP